jgi:hypothetical protein
LYSKTGGINDAAACGSGSSNNDQRLCVDFDTVYINGIVKFLKTKSNFNCGLGSV